MKSAFLAAIILFSNAGQLIAQECPEVETAPNFDFEAYSKAPWYVHQQMPISYLPIDTFYCVKAEYSERNPSWWQFQYTVNVYNEAAGEDRDIYGGDLCAYDKGPDPAKLAVAPCFLPTFLGGDYWVVAYNESENLDEEFALVSGGQPTTYTDQGCRNSFGYFNAGLWIFTRNQERDETLVRRVRSIARAKGFDLRVLEDVDHTNCSN